MVLTVVTAHTLCASGDTQVSYGWQSRSQSPRYPCPAERDKGNEGSGNEIVWMVPTNTGIFLLGLKLCGENSTFQMFLVPKKKIGVVMHS